LSALGASSRAVDRLESNARTSDSRQSCAHDAGHASFGTE
jgi:hypothetical protein